MFGTVHLLPAAIYLSEEPLCMKMIRVKADQHNNLLESTLAEAAHLAALNDVSGVPRVVAVSLDPPGIIMTHHGTQTLGELIRNAPETHPDDSLLWDVMKQLIWTVHQIHERGLHHNDLKADNVTVEISTQKEVSVFILDCGLMSKKGEPGPIFSKLYDKGNFFSNYKTHEKLRKKSYGWCAPELYHEGKSTPASDVHALCTVCLEIIKKFNRPDECIDEFRNLLTLGIHESPESRPKLRDIAKSLIAHVQRRNKI